MIAVIGPSLMYRKRWSTKTSPNNIFSFFFCPLKSQITVHWSYSCQNLLSYLNTAVIPCLATANKIKQPMILRLNIELMTPFFGLFQKQSVAAVPISSTIFFFFICQCRSEVKKRFNNRPTSFLAVSAFQTVHSEESKEKRDDMEQMLAPVMQLKSRLWVHQQQQLRGHEVLLFQCLLCSWNSPVQNQWTTPWQTQTLSSPGPL